MDVRAQGRLGAAPTRTRRPPVRKMVTASLAVQVPDKSIGAAPHTRQTFWLRLVAVGENAEHLAAHGKGEVLEVWGSVRYSGFMGRDGVARNAQECLVQSLYSDRIVSGRVHARAMTETLRDIEARTEGGPGAVADRTEEEAALVLKMLDAETPEAQQAALDALDGKGNA